jgi:hypothetical protein
VRHTLTTAFRQLREAYRHDLLQLETRVQRCHRDAWLDATRDPPDRGRPGARAEILVEMAGLETLRRWIAEEMTVCRVLADRVDGSPGCQGRS